MHETRCLFLVASQQVMHHLEAIQCWIDPTADSKLIIYHTDDEFRSASPARRLKEFVNRNFSGSVTCELFQGDTSPQSVIKYLGTVRAAYGNHVKWIINASGGTKPMAAALMNLADDPQVEVYYRELNLGWVRISKVENQFVTEPARLTCNLSFEQLPLQDLIGLQVPLQPGQTLSSSPIPNIDPLEVVKVGCQCNWNWQTIMERCDPDGQRSGGLFFECLIGAALRRLGIHSVCRGLMLKGADGFVLYEVDVLAVSENRVLIFDCKLQSFLASPWIEQIQLADERRLWLGGLNSKTVLIRPNLRPTADHVALAQAYGISILGPHQASGLFAELARFVGLPLPDELAQADELLRKCDDWMITPFTDGRIYKLKNKSEFGASIVSLQPILEHLKQQRQQDWTGYRTETVLHLRFPKLSFGEGNQRGKNMERFLSLLENFGKSKMRSTSASCLFEVQWNQCELPRIKPIRLVEYLDRHPQSSTLISELESFVAQSLAHVPPESVRT